MNLYPPRPTTIVFAGIPIGVAYAHDPAITVAITTALGSALRLSASDTAIGTISAVVAVLDMKFVSTHVTTNITSRRTVGLGLEPIIPTILSAISVPAPVFSRALASASEPPNNSTTFKSIDFNVDCQHFFRQIFLGYFPDIVQAFDTLGRNVYGDDYTSLHNPIVLSSVLLVYGMFHSTQILF